MQLRTRIHSNFSTQNNTSHPICETHSKKIEAFCDLDKKILCIDCILNENHKSHEILAIDKATIKEKIAMENHLKTAV